MNFAAPRTQFVTLSILLLAGLGTLCTGGCQSLPRSGLDPYGERLFESCPLDNLRPSNWFGGKKDTSTGTPQTVTATPIPEPITGGAVVYPGSSPGGTISGSSLPGQLGSGQSGMTFLPNYGSTATSMGSGVRGINTAIVASPDAGPTPVFEETGGYALPTIPVEGPALVMTPREQIAPIGSEVVLISSYVGKGDRLVTNEKIEWTLEGVGAIQKLDAGSCCDPLFFDYVRAKKVTDRYAVTKTSQVYQTLDRGTVETKDDLHLLRGQTWVSVNSMKEGTTHVTAFAPSLKDWSKRTDVGIIHWVDALWVLPRLAIAPVGESRGLTTTVLRQTNGQPRQNWIVQYEILNGPPAGFGPSQAQIVEERTDMSGQASVILYPKEHRSGTCTIGIKIIRPAGVDGSDRRVTVGSETVRQTWAGSSNVFIDLQAPADGKVGQDLPYKMTVSNKTSGYVRGVVALSIPPSAACTASNPSAQQKDSTLLWDVEVPPQGASVITFSLKFGSVGAPILTPQFYQQGASSHSTPSISGTSVPPVSSGSVGLVNPPGTPPTAPNTPPATVYQGGNTGTTGAAPPATVFPGANNKNLGQRLGIEIVTPRVELNKPVEFTFRVTNNGNTTIRNGKLVVDFPPEFKATVKGETSAGESGQDDTACQVVLYSAPIPPRGSAYITLIYPTTTLQGHRIAGKFYLWENVNGLERIELIDQTSTQVTPVH